MRFIYSPCGHLIGCDDPDFDLAAEQERRKELHFESQLEIAIKRGEHVYSSSSPLTLDIEDAIAAVADNPTQEAIDAARREFRGEPHSELVTLATGVDLACARPISNVTIRRFTYWDNSPGLLVEAGNLAFAATFKLRPSDPPEPAPGNVLIINYVPFKDLNVALRRLNIVGDAIQSNYLYCECPLLV